MNEKAHTPTAIAKMDVEAAFKLVEFYENAAAVVKGRTWAITAWILTVNSALLAFCFQLYMQSSQLHGFIWIQAAICCVGTSLCVFLCFLILDQGNHLSHYWTSENKIGAWNTNVQDLVLSEKEARDVRKPGYQAPFPKFCKRLILLSIMYSVGFLGTFLLMWKLAATENAC